MAKYAINPDIYVVSIHIIHEGLMEVHYQRNKESTDPPDYVSPITAVFTTSHARVSLLNLCNYYIHRSYFTVILSHVILCIILITLTALTQEHQNSLIRWKLERGQWECEFSDGKNWCASGAESYVVQCINAKNNCLKTTGLTVDFKNRDITFKAMSDIAQIVNTIPIGTQQV